MKNQRGFLAPLAILVIATIIVGAGGYAWYKTTPTESTKEISRAIFSDTTPEGRPPAVQSVTEKIVEHTSQAVLNSLDEQRQKGNNQRIQSNLGSFRASAEIYFDSQSPGSYGIAVTGAAGCSTQGSMFVSNVYTGNTNYKPLLDPSDYPTSTQLVCNVSADGKTYAVQANLIGGGYWCVDSTKVAKAESSPLGTGTVCK